MKRYLLVVCLLVIPACASHTPPPTPIAAVADTVTRLEQSGDVMVHAAQAAHLQLNPATGAPLLSTEQLVAVALAGDRLGHVGINLGHALATYRTLQASGGDLTQARAAVRDLITMVTQALASIGQAIPKGTLATIDQAVTDSFAIVAQIQAATGLQGSL